MICSACKKNQDISQFVSLCNGKQTKMCLRCRLSNHKHSRNTARKKSEVVSSIKDKMGACECGETRADRIQFHHIACNKVCSVGGSTTIAKMRAEAGKCIALCMKCHKKLTFKDRTYKKPPNRRARNDQERATRNRNYVNQCKLMLGGCQNPKCDDVFDPDNLEFYEYDHIDFTEKTKSISVMALQYRSSFARLDQELAKCQLLCGYCHFERTQEQNTERREHFLKLETPIPEPTPPLSINSEIIKEIRDLYRTGNCHPYLNVRVFISLSY